jgi:anti-sigma regulatory factor (Ser/Thr protein kinase)
MEMSHQVIQVVESSQVGDARRAATALARAQDFDDEAVGRVAIAVSEAATNLVKHGGGGQLILERAGDADARGIVVVAIDRGPGIADAASALRDGFSTRGSAGTGLGAIARQANGFDLYSSPGVGTAVFADFWTDDRATVRAGLVVGGLSVPCPGQVVCGDAWIAVHAEERTMVLVADGLGHGPGAAEAADTAIATFRAHAARQGPGAIVERLHAALRGTRGAAVAVADVDRTRARVRFAGVGNVAGTVLDGDRTRSMVSHHGTAGHEVRRVQEFDYPWPHDGLLVLHTDGLLTRWTLDRYPGLARHHPTLVAAVLYRDFARGRDDTTVVAAREAA